MPAKFSILAVAAMPIIPIALACGGDDGGGKISVRPDSKMDATPVVCTAGSSYSGVIQGSNTQIAGSDGTPGMTSGSDAYQVFWLGRMDPTAMPDWIQLTLYEGYGPYTGGIIPGTVNLAGENSAFSTCSTCMFLFTDLHAAGSGVEITDYYMPTAGTLNITDVSDTFVGTMTNVTLQHMVISGNDLVPANDGCTATIASASMNVAMRPQGSGSAVGKGEAPGKSFQFKLSNRTF
jgi:hypothetical protein